MESSLIRILPACLTEPLPKGWDKSSDEFVIEVMPEVEQAEAILLALPTTEPDILLLDAQVSGVDVFEIAARALEVRPDLAIVLLSADSSPEMLRRAMLAGAEEYLIKPLEAKALRESIIGIAGHRTLRVIERGANDLRRLEGVGVTLALPGQPRDQVADRCDSLWRLHNLLGLADAFTHPGEILHLHASSSIR